MFRDAIALACDERRQLLSDMTVVYDMEMHRKLSGKSAPTQDGGNGRFFTIGVPLPYEGVGNALRASFYLPREALPDDMMALLAKLDRR